MDRYVLFAWSQYYPRGGFNDLYNDFESEEFAREVWEDIKGTSNEYGQIVDTLTGNRWDLYAND